jgi:Trypsin-like peptidase domain
MRCLQFLLALTVLAAGALGADPPKLLRSVSGPSGKTAGSDFILDETRNRFVYPNDKSLVIYFEWEASLGDHVLTAAWRQPDGRIASISPDVKMQTNTPLLKCYWGFTLYTGMDNGVWTLEVRVDGQPAGSHSFEIAGMAQVAQPALTVDQLFKSLSPSMVWIRKLGEDNRRIDFGSGFVIGRDAVATAFQSVDSAVRVEVEFADGRKITTNEVYNLSRAGDWAVLKVDTGSVPPIPRGDSAGVLVGDRMLVFDFDSSARVISAVNVGGRQTVSLFGERIYIGPAMRPEVAGGPLADSMGKVVGILGGSLRPGERSEQRKPIFAFERGGLLTPEGAELIISAATPIAGVPQNFIGDTRTLEQLTKDDILTPLVVPIPEFQRGGTTADLPKRASDPISHESRDFSVRNAQISVFSVWQRAGKISKGLLSAKVYDVANRITHEVPPTKISILDNAQRFSFNLSPAQLQPGTHRIDLLFDGRPVWLTFIRITE